MTRTLHPSAPRNDARSERRRRRGIRAVVARVLAALAAILVAVAAGPVGDAPAAAAAAQVRPVVDSQAEASGPLSASEPILAAPSSEARTSRTSAPGDILISELANGGRGSRSDSFFELVNAGDTPVDLTGWEVARCSMQGLRANLGRTETDLHGVVLEPGEFYTGARIGTDLGGVDADGRFSQPFADTGFGLVVLDPAGEIVDAVGVYPNEPWPTTSECSRGGNLPNSLSAALGESWQRVGRTGDARADFVRAVATPGGVNATKATDAPAAPVRIAELAPTGPEGGDDEFVELAAVSDTDVSGWRLLTCGVNGRQQADRAVAVVPDGTRLRAGERFVVAADGASADADLRSRLALDARGFGALLVDADGYRVDGVAATPYGDSACQSGDEKLGLLVDGRTGESWQRVDATGDDAEWVVAPRTPGAANAATERALRDEPTAYPARPGVVVTELATDPGDLPDGFERRNFVELTNVGDAPVDVSGWTLVRCTESGPRVLSGGTTIVGGTTLAPGDAWVAALRGTALAANADAVLDDGFDFRGTGVWVEDADGRVVDRVGVYRANEMDRSVERPSLCTKGMSLQTFALDRYAGETYQRIAFTGVDADDFAARPATPGDGAVHPAVDPVAPALAEARSALVRAVAAEERAAQQGARRAAALARGTDASDGIRAIGASRTAGPMTALKTSAATPLRVTAGWTGTSDAPLTAHGAPAERPLASTDSDTTADTTVRDDGYGLPYVRLAVEASDPGAALETGATVAWRGSAEPRTAVRLSAWNAEDASWRMLAEATAGADGSVALAGALLDGEIAPGDTAGAGTEASAELLVQVVPRASTLRKARGGGFDDPADYDLAISHLTDTQYLTESHPEAYAEIVGWVAANAPSRKIAFATHTGDLVQNWVDPDQSEPLARREYETASRMQAVLDDAGVPNSVLPGNHDTKRGTSPALFNEYFPPSRYADEPWYGGSIGPDDQTANFSLFEQAGAPFLMLSLPYAYGEREIAWAEEVVAAHPDRNVIVSTHEHVTPKELEAPAQRSTSSRWLSRADELWARVIAPNRNVVVVLSGHFHGLGAITTEDAGGLPGHTVVEMVADYQEFRTHEGVRATGFQRLLQFDLAGGAIAVDAYSSTLDAHASYPYDYVQFDPAHGSADELSEMRPWNIVERGVQGRYTAEDDEFVVEHVGLQYAKSLTTVAITGDVASEPSAPADAGR
ncbi:hypothetical protein ET445_10440 [Agromyces protaetiae]|uniref:LTD domain-containing protein n=1 Tax=Agromyces protaetiae TaxID=2509455 RepID=A0A4P6FCD1_9MICO|nr:lamin tail domain-containing protein [Agromyces protaetiae]QAY73702.1 hypothetical protein ET445_10440 [Agromyces protaetiae]